MSNPQFDDYVNKIASELIEHIEAGTAPWQRPWDGVMTGAVNATTMKPYNGMNALLLLLQQYQHHYDDPRWLTFKQGQALGGHVKKGEHGVPCIYWKTIELEDETSPSSDPEGLPQPKRLMIPCRFTVFNVSQFEGLDLPAYEVPHHEWTPVEAAERILKNSGAIIFEKSGEKAFYSPDSDSITLPERVQFPTAEQFYDTALHELGHWTGHSSRLNRDLTGHFGSDSYAREELRAEISSMMVSMAIGLPHNTDQHAAYVQNWVSVLRSDPKEIFRATTDADRIKDYVVKFEKEHFYVLNYETNEALYLDKSQIIKEVQTALKSVEVKEHLEQLIAQESEKSGDPEEGLFKACCLLLDPRQRSNEQLLLNRHKGLVVTKDINEFLQLSQNDKSLQQKAMAIVTQFEGKSAIEKISRIESMPSAVKNNREMVDQPQKATLDSTFNPSLLGQKYYVYNFKTKEFGQVGIDELDRQVKALMKEQPELMCRYDSLVRRYVNDDGDKRTLEQSQYKAIRSLLDPTIANPTLTGFKALNHPGLVISSDSKDFLLGVGIESETAYQNALSYLKGKEPELDSIRLETDFVRSHPYEASPFYASMYINVTNVWKTLGKDNPKESPDYYVVNYQTQSVSLAKQKDLLGLAQAVLSKSPAIYEDFLNKREKFIDKSQDPYHSEFSTLRMFVDPTTGASLGTLKSVKHPGIGVFKDKAEFVFSANIHSEALGKKAASLCEPIHEDSVRLYESVSGLERMSPLAQTKWKMSHKLWRGINVLREVDPKLTENHALNQSCYLVDYDANKVSEINGVEALQKAQARLANVTPSTKDQQVWLKSVFDPKSPTQISAVNALLYPGNKDSLCRCIDDKGLYICDSLEKARKACSIKPDLSNQLQQLVPEAKDKKAKDNNVQLVCEKIRAQNTWFKIQCQRHKQRQNDDKELLKRFPSVSKTELKEIKKEVHRRVHSLATPYLSQHFKASAHKTIPLNQATPNYELSR